MIETKIQKWGNSFGLRIPIDELRKKNISEDETVIVTIKKKKKLSDLFGVAHFKEPIDKVVKDAKKGSR